MVGGGGVAPLACSEPDICELQKMYFMTSARGQGLAKKLALLALDYAREQGFKRCYLETTASVSYTHLDVYKRQIKTGAEAAHRHRVPQV